MKKLMCLFVFTLTACSTTATTPTRAPVIAITLFPKPTAFPKPTRITATPKTTRPPAPNPPTLTPLPTVVATPVVPPTAAATPISTEPPMPTPNAPIVIATTAADPNANSDARTEMLNLHNQVRNSLGLKAYVASPALHQAAQLQADFLATQAREILFGLGPRGHIGADGSTPVQRVAATAYIGNAEESWAFDNTVKGAFDWWLGDQFHRPQIVSPNYTEIGIGLAPHPSGGIIFVAVYAMPK